MQIEIGNRHRGDRGVYVGRGTALGNPYVVGRDGSRRGVVDLYKRWLWIRMQDKDSKQWNALLGLLKHAKKTGGVTLVCSCAPLLCHAEIIRAALYYIEYDMDENLD